MRLLNCFPAQQPFKIIEEIVSFAGLQLDIHLDHIQLYSKHRQHISRHQDHLRHYLKLSSFKDKVSAQLSQFLFDEALRIEQNTLLLNKARAYLMIL